MYLQTTTYLRGEDQPGKLQHLATFCYVLLRSYKSQISHGLSFNITSIAWAQQGAVLSDTFCRSLGSYIYKLQLI